MPSQASFAAKLRWWREHKGLSQLALAGRAGISQRHLSFLELARATPSRQMVLRLAEALDVPLRQHNALLLAAGFAPAWRETQLEAAERRLARNDDPAVMRARGQLLAIRDALSDHRAYFEAGAYD